MTREEALERLLEPIKWNWSSSLGARRNYVSKKHDEARIAYPFLTEEEKKKADEWFKKESHSGLWK